LDKASRRIVDDAIRSNPGNADDGLLNVSAASLGFLPPKLEAPSSTLAAARSLDLSFNTFGTFPRIDAYTCLTSLTLAGNHLTSMAGVLFPPTLLELTLTGNRLVSLGSELAGLRSLERLNLSNNEVATLGDHLSCLQNLEELDVSGNPLPTLPEGCGWLVSLEIFNAAGCKLSVLPDEFTWLTRLLEINLGHQSPGLHELPSNIGRLTRLSRLEVSDNKLRKLPPSAGLLEGLNCIGSGWNIDRNPLEDERAIARYRMGTDHLAQYLAGQLQQWVTDRKKAGLDPAPVDPFDGPVLQKDGTWRRATPPARSGTPSLAGSAAPSGTSSGRASPAVPSGGGGGSAATTASDKIAVLCDWASKEISSVVRPTLSDLQDTLADAPSMELAAPAAKRIRDVRAAVEHIAKLMAPLDRTPTPDIAGVSDKLSLLKMVVRPIVTDALRILDAALVELDALDELGKAVEFVRGVKAIVAALGTKS
jgi:hypothetical protein